MTTPDLTHLEALDAAATPGPWAYSESGAITAPLSSDEIADVWEPTGLSRNGEFIETARTALPALVTEARTHRRLLADVEQHLSALHGSVARHDNLGANLACSGCQLRDQIRDALRDAR